MFIFVDILTDGCEYLLFSSRGGLRVSEASHIISAIRNDSVMTEKLDLEYIMSAITIKAMTRLLYVALKLMTLHFLCFAWCCSQS